MKKLFTLLVIASTTLCLNAQYLNVTDVYFVDDPSASASSDTGLAPGGAMILKFDFRNNLPNRMDLNPGDSVTFGWSALGARIGTLGTRSWPSHMAHGMSAKLYSHEHIPLPRDSCFAWEVCVWPLYNPYAPNTDSLKGRHCTTFKTKCFAMPKDTSKDTTSKPSSIVQDNELVKPTFTVINRSIHFDFKNERGLNSIQLYTLSGDVVLSELVGSSGVVKIESQVSRGIYLLDANSNNERHFRKVFVQ